MTIILVIIIWFLSGCSGFAYWWTRDFKLKVTDLWLMALVGICLGVSSWVVGWILHKNLENLNKEIRS